MAPSKIRERSVCRAHVASGRGGRVEVGERGVVETKGDYYDSVVLFIKRRGAAVWGRLTSEKEAQRFPVTEVKTHCRELERQQRGKQVMDHQK